MVLNYQKKIKEGKVDESVHAKFIRFGLGDFKREEFIVKKGKKIELKAGFDFADIFTRFVAENAAEDIEVKGIIISSNKNLESILKEVGLDVVASRGKKYTVSGTLSPEQLQKALDKLSGMIVLLSAESGDLMAKCKPAAPKPGSLKEKLCSLKVPADMWDMIKEEFLYDVEQEGKQFSIKYSYHIEEIVVDDNLAKSDPARARKEGKRKGKIKREIWVNKEKVGETELKFEA